MKTIMQGDSYPIKFYTTSFQPEEITSMEFSIGHLIKTYLSDNTGEVTYNSADQTYNFPITQEESFLIEGKQPVQIRIVKDGCIYGVDLGNIFVKKSISREELEVE